MNSLLFCILCFFIILLTGVSYTSCKKRLKIKRWQQSYNLQTHAPIFNQLYLTTNGFLLSQTARQKYDSLEYAYGEIEFFSFIALLSLIKPDENTVFYDLGSGTGKAVLACSMVFPVHQSVGIELFPELYLCSYKQVERLATIKSYEVAAKKIKFILADFLDVNLNEATFIFINSTAFFGPTWEKLCAKIDRLPNLNTVITTSKTLSCSQFKLLQSTKVQMSWGVVIAFIHIRKSSITQCIENIE